MKVIKAILMFNLWIIFCILMVHFVTRVLSYGKVSYIRDKSHACILKGVDSPMKTVGIFGTVKYVGGWSVYSCNDDVKIVIDRGDIQP